MSYFKKGDKMRNDEGYVPKETLAEVQALKSLDIPERNISKATLERFGVKVAVSEKDGKTPTAVYFPSHNQKGKITGYTKQDLTKSKEEKGHWTAVGSVTIGNKLFGQNVAESQNRKRNNLVATEGQWDCLSVFEALVNNVKGTKYEGLEPW